MNKSIKRKSKIVIFLSLLLSGVALIGFGSFSSVAESEDSSEWLPIGIEDIERIISAHESGVPITSKTADQILNEMESNSEASAKKINRFKNEKDRLENEGDNIWIITGRNLELSYILAGKGKKIHSIEISVAVVNMTQDENRKSFELISALLAQIFPGWKAAESWPLQSLKEAWDRREGAKIVEHKLDEYTVATYGVPPDIVVYTITGRERCIPDLKKGNPFLLLIC